MRAALFHGIRNFITQHGAEGIAEIIPWFAAIGLPLLACWGTVSAIEAHRGENTEPKPEEYTIAGLAGWCCLLLITWLGWTPAPITWFVWLVGLLVGVVAAGLCFLAFQHPERKGPAKEIGEKGTDREGMFGLAGAGAVFCVVTIFASSANSVDIPTLPREATVEEVASAYRDRSYFIAIEYTAHVEQPGLFGARTESVSGGGLGSGILIANDGAHGLIVTNRHVVDPSFNGRQFSHRSLRAKSPTQASFAPVELAAYHQTLDLALLIVEDDFPGRGAIRVIEEAKIRQGESAVALGNPLGVESIISEGIISGRSRGELTTTCPIGPGNSGGPLVLRRHGYLAGINTASAVESQNLNFSVPAEYILRSFEEEGHWAWQAHQETAERLIRLVPLERN